MISRQLATAALAAVLLRSLAVLLKKYVLDPLRDPLARLQRPRAAWFQGQFRLLTDARLLDNWKKLYGPTFVYQKSGRHDLRLITLDFTAVSHVLTEPSLFGKPDLNRSLFAHPDVVHPSFTNFASPMLNRKLITPAFSGRSLMAMSSIFFQRAEDLRDSWLADIDRSPTAAHGTMTLDVIPPIIQTTFEVVSNACFDTQSNRGDNSENGKSDAADHQKLFRALHHLAEPISTDHLTWRRRFTSLIPNGDLLFPSDAINLMNSMLEDVAEIGLKLIQSKKQAIIAEANAGMGESQVKPLLNLLVKSNMAAEPTKRLSELEILDQVGGIMIAGGDTVGVALSWTLHLLSIHPEIQSQLREQLLDIPHNASEVSLLNTLSEVPLLDAVLKEALRVCPPVHGLVRGALEDTMIPLSEPIMVGGKETRHVEIRKGSVVHIPIEGLNLSEDLWGPDAAEFRPQRWLDCAGASPMVGGMRNPGLERVMSFSFGAFACQGYRMAMHEAKVVLDVLLRAFVFRPAEGIEIGKCQTLFTMPNVTGTQGPRLPLVVEKYE
ncbi:putative monooxygenase [Serpula lacrymans var. lacrymans S7.9]|uniref:Putative monooxygenase n=1 Tax=Serpula lacrymans var. lacrymans (strain S7.9) TaxID=578457 RepID=F8P0Z2_SERL9|nr:putative monooxygenase [Serpula lacrymans var. lacrymans S7.9]EGO22825.1 putative monooxygenase [Serpula lacrymans var. lacrymans S7.9]